MERQVYSSNDLDASNRRGQTQGTKKSALKILRQLAGRDLTWSELLKMSGMLSRTMSKHLRELERLGTVRKKVEYGRKGIEEESGKARDLKRNSEVVYYLARSRHRKAMVESARKLDDYEEMAEKIQCYTELFFRSKKRYDPKLASEYFTTIGWAIVYVTETEILRRRTNFYDDSFVTLEASQTLQKMLLSQKFQRTMKHELLQDLEADREECCKKIEKAIDKLESMVNSQ